MNWKLPDDHKHLSELHAGGMIYRVEGGIVQDVADAHAGQLRGFGATPVVADDHAPAKKPK